MLNYISSIYWGEKLLFKKLKEWGSKQASNKSVVVIFSVSILVGLLGMLILIDVSNGNIGSIADWIAAIGTSGAVFFAVQNRTDKAKIVVSASYVEYVIFDHDFIGTKENIHGECEPVYDEKTNGLVNDANTDLRIYLVNKRQSSGLIASWGIIDSENKKFEMSSKPFFVKGFYVVQISRHMDFEDNDDFVINRIEKITKKNKKFRLYFEEVRGAIIYCSLEKQMLSNETH